MTLPAIAASLLFLLQAPKGSIEGTVVSSTTNQPVAGAQVTANRSQVSPDLAAQMSAGLIGGFAGRPAPPPANQMATTDRDGRFILHDIDPGTYVLSASADGYSRQPQIDSAKYGKRDTLLAVTVKVAEATPNVVFHLMPAGNVSGRVVGANGEPLAGMEVAIFRPDYTMSGRRVYSQLNSALTNDRGEFRLSGMMPGMTYMSVKPSPRLPLSQNNRYPRTFYPNATKIEDAAEFEISPGGDLTGMDFRLSLPPSYTIRGRVIDASTGRFPSSASIAILPREQPVGSVAPSNGLYNQNDGTFELRDVFAGSYLIRAQLSPLRPVNSGGRPSATPSALAEIEVKHDVNNVVLTITPLVSVQGRMRIEGPASNDGPWSVTLVPPASTALIYPNVVPAKVQTDGTFHIENVVQGEYQVSVPGIGLRGGGPLGQIPFIKEAHIGSIDLLTETFKITGAAIGEIQIVLSRNAGEILGNVVDEQQKPAGPVELALVPDDRKQTDLYRTVLTGIDGKFSLKGVPAGTYKIFALSPPDVASFFDPAVMKKFEAAARSVTVAESSSQTVVLKVLRAP